MRVSTELNKSEAASFKHYLRTHNINYESSGCWELVHFECEMTEQQVNDANNFIDSCSDDCWHY